MKFMNLNHEGSPIYIDGILRNSLYCENVDHIFLYFSLGISIPSYQEYTVAFTNVTENIGKSNNTKFIIYLPGQRPCVRWPSLAVY